MTKKIKMMTRSTWEDKGDEDDIEDTEINDNEDEDEEKKITSKVKYVQTYILNLFVLKTKIVRLLWNW